VREGKATPTPVEVGIRTDSSVQILSGIAPGDTVLTTGLLQLRPQMSVSAAVSTPQAQQ
jgi:membrane fusion protein (multidrug efflux system)